MFCLTLMIRGIARQKIFLNRKNYEDLMERLAILKGDKCSRDRVRV